MIEQVASNKDEKSKRTMHLFAGAGGGILADLILGHTPIVAVEWDEFCCEVLRERVSDGWFSGMHVWEGDVSLFDPSEYSGRVDCIHAGFPCQDLSVAGAGAGLGEGTRSGLYREVLRVADTVRPSELFLENVTNINSAGVGTVYGDLAARGYEFRTVCLRASDVGARHHRDRWWCLARRMADSMRTGWEKQHATTESKSEGLNTGSNDSGGVFWRIEPRLGRVANGVANRSHRIKAIGNGQVPLQAAAAYKILESLF